MEDTTDLSEDQVKSDAIEELKEETSKLIQELKSEWEKREQSLNEDIAKLRAQNEILKESYVKAMTAPAPPKTEDVVETLKKKTLTYMEYLK